MRGRDAQSGQLERGEIHTSDRSAVFDCGNPVLTEIPIGSDKLRISHLRERSLDAVKVLGLVGVGENGSEEFVKPYELFRTSGSVNLEIH